MSWGEAYRRGQQVVVVATASALVLAGTSCARRGPPAPLDDRTGIYYASPAKPKAEKRRAERHAVETQVAKEQEGRSTPPVMVAPSRRAPVTSEELAPPPQPAPPAASESAKAVQPPSETARETAPPAAGRLTTTDGGTVKVRKGETLFAVSRREKIPIRALIDANGLKPPYHLNVGQTLRVPGLRVYTVAPGDTVYGISRRFDVGINDVVRENGIEPPDFSLYVGQRVVLPLEEDGLPRSSSAQTALARVPPLDNTPVGDPNAKPPPRASRKFQWPLRGKVVSTFGAKGGGLYNDGINIAAKPGTIVRAAENGIVAYAGNELRGYGNLLLVRHADGWISAYAHNGELLVRPGQAVKRGQPIARVGNSGAVASPQLHFELRRGRKAVDPRRYLG